MKKRMQHALATIPAIALMGFAVPASADDISDFYTGKTLTVMVPSGIGASLGLYGRLVTEFIGEHVPGKPNVIIQERPGGGGTLGAAFAYNAAPKDGTFIAEVLAPSVLVPVLRASKFDPTKFQWLGSLTPRPAVVSVWHTSPVKTVEDAKKHEAIMGSTGVGSSTYIIPTMMNALLGTKFKVVKGYKGGGPVNKAMEAGEVQGRMQYWSGWTAGKPAWLRDKLINHLVKYGGVIPELPDVPQLIDLVEGKEAKSMVSFLEAEGKIGMGFWVAPGVPADRVAALRTAFEAMMADPKFIEAAKKRNAPVELVKHAELQKIVEEAYSIPKETVDKMKNILGFK